jgi:hypothetical protein
VEGEPQFHACFGIVKVGAEEFTDARDALPDGVAMDAQFGGRTIPASVPSEPDEEGL